MSANGSNPNHWGTAFLGMKFHYKDTELGVDSDNFFCGSFLEAVKELCQYKYCCAGHGVAECMTVLQISFLKCFPQIWGLQFWRSVHTFNTALGMSPDWTMAQDMRLPSLPSYTAWQLSVSFTHPRAIFPLENSSYSANLNVECMTHTLEQFIGADAKKPSRDHSLISAARCSWGSLIHSITHGRPPSRSIYKQPPYFDLCKK